MHPVLLTLVVFAVTLFIAHIPIIFVRRYRSGKIADRDRWALLWERSDYFSLGIGLLVLLPAANEVYRLQNADELMGQIKGTPDSLKVGDVDYVRFDSIAAEYQKSNSQLGRFLEQIERDRSEAKHLLEVGRGKEAYVILNRIITAYEMILIAPPMGLKEMPEGIKDNEIKDVTRFCRQIAERNADAKQLRERYLSTQKPSVEIKFLLFAPYVLAIGLAVRLAKVSAKILLERQKQIVKTATPVPEASSKSS